MAKTAAAETVLSAGDPLFVGITLKKRKGANAGPGYSAGELPAGLKLAHNDKVYITQEVVANAEKGTTCTRWKVFSD